MFFGARPPNENLSGSVSQLRTSHTSHGRPRLSENTCQDGHRASFSSQIVTGAGSKRPQCSPAVTQYISPPEYNNRFTRMNLEKDVIIRTVNGFVDFFHSNACHMLKETWEKVIIPRKRFEETPLARKTLVEDRSPRSIQSSSDSKIECFGELESKPVIVDLTTKEEKASLPPKSSRTPLSDKDNIQQKSVGGENEAMHNSRVLTKSMENQVGRAKKKPVELPGTYDRNFKNRCRSYMVKRQCFDHFCQYLHSLPKDDNILCKGFEGGICPKTKEECWFKHRQKKNVAKRCFEYLTNRWCSKGSYCNFLHRLPKDDNILCNFFLLGNCKYEKSECIYLHKKEDENTCDKKIASRCKAAVPKDDNILCKRFQAGDCLESAESCNFKHGKTSNTSEEISEKDLDARGETSEGNSDTHNALGSFRRGVHPIENSQDDRVSSKTIATLPTNVNTVCSHSEGKHVSEIPKSNTVKMTGSVSPNQSEIPVLAKDSPPKQHGIDNNGKPLSEVGKNIFKDCDQSQILDSQEETKKSKTLVPDTNPSLIKSLEESQNVMNSHDRECSHSLSPIKTKRKLHAAPPTVKHLNEQSKATPVEHLDINSQTGKQPTESATSPSVVGSENLESEPQIIQPSAQPTVVEGGQSCQSTDTGTEKEISKPEPSVSNVDALTLKHHEESQNDSVKLDDKCSHYTQPMWDSGNNFENMSRVVPMNEKSEGGVSESAEQLGIHTSTEDSLPGKQPTTHERKSIEAPVQPLVVKDGEFLCVDMAEETSQPVSICPVTDTPLKPLKELPTGASSQDDSSSQSVKPLPTNRDPAEVSHGNEACGSSPISHLPRKSKSGGGPIIKEKCKSKSDQSPGLSDSLKNEDIQHKRKKYTVAVENMTDTEHLKGKQYMECKQKSIQYPVQSLIVKDGELHCVGNEAETNQPESFSQVTDIPIFKSPKKVQIYRKSHGNQSSQSVTPLQANKDPAEVGLGSETSGSSPIMCLTDKEEVRKYKLKDTGQENIPDIGCVKGKQYLECEQNSVQSPAQPLAVKVAELHRIDNEADNNQIAEVQMDLKPLDMASSQRVRPLKVNKDPAEVGPGNKSSGLNPISHLTDNKGEIKKCKEKAENKKLKKKGTSNSDICPTNTAVISDKSKVLFDREKQTFKRRSTASNATHITPCKKSQTQKLFGSSSGSDSADEFSKSGDIQYKRKKLTVAQENKIDIEQERVDDEVKRKVKRSLLTHRDAPAFKKRKHLPCEEESLSSSIRECKLGKSMRPTYYVKDDGSGFPISSATTREDLFYVIGRIVGFQGVPREEDFNELYSEFARLYEELTQWKLLKSGKSDKFVVLEANVRILIACIYNDEEGALKMKDSLVEHWRREPDLRAFKKRMELFVNNRKSVSLF